MIRQPEVSIAITALRKLGFVNAEQIVVPGKKGQYTNEYSLAVPLPDIIDHFWQIKLKEWGDMMDNYKKLSEYEIRPFSG
jgi:predicted transcriptional regulator